MKTELKAAITQLSAERNLPKEIVLSALESALASAYKKSMSVLEQDVAVKVDPDESVRYVALFVLYSISRDSSSFFEEVSKTDASNKIRSQAQEYYRLRSINQ
jgi:hypothetical protein